jgi:hypothetical protein
LKESVKSWKKKKGFAPGKFRRTFLFLFLFLAVWGTQGLTLARQVLYHLSHAASPFCFFYFWVSPFMPGQVWMAVLLFMLPTITGMTGVHQHAHLLLVKVGSCKLLPGMNLNCNTAILLISPSKVARITGINHRTWWELASRLAEHSISF